MNIYSGRRAVYSHFCCDTALLLQDKRGHHTDDRVGVIEHSNNFTRQASGFGRNDSFCIRCRRGICYKSKSGILEKFNCRPVTMFSLRFLIQHLRSGARALSSAAAEAPLRFEYKHVIQTCSVLEKHYHLPDSKLDPLLDRSVLLSQEVFIQVLEKFMRDANRAPAWRFFQWSSNQHNFHPGTVACNKMIDILGKTGEIQTIWVVLQQMKQQRILTIKTLEVAVRAFAGGNQILPAVRVFEFFQEANVSVDVGALNFVFRSLLKARLGLESYKILRKLKLKPLLVQPDAASYGLVVSALCKSNELILALKLWNEILNHPDIEAVDASVCDELMDALLRKKRVFDALKIFHSVSCTANAQTYGIIIVGLCKLGMVAKARKLFDEMREFALVPDGSVSQALVTAMGSNGRLRKAYALLGEIDKPARSMAYNGLLKALVTLGRAQQANRLFHRMVRDGCEPIMHTYVMLMQVNFGFRRGKSCRKGLDFYTIFVGGLVKQGRTREAYKYLESTVYDEVDVPRFDYNKFLSNLCCSSSEGQHVWRQVAERLRQSGNVLLSNVFLRFLQKMTSREGRRASLHF